MYYMPHPISDKIFNHLVETLRLIREPIRRNIERQELQVSAGDILGVLLISFIMNSSIVLRIDELTCRRKSRMRDCYKLLTRYTDKKAIKEFFYQPIVLAPWLVSKALSGLKYGEVMDAVNLTLDLQFELASKANLIGGEST